MEAKRIRSEIKNAIWIAAEKGDEANITLLLPNGMKLCKKIGKATQAQADHIAMREALKVAEEEKEKIKIYTESAVVEGNLLKGWRYKSNKWLVKKTIKIYDRVKDKVEIYKIKKVENLARK